LGEALAVGALAVAMVLAAMVGLLIPAVGFAVQTEAGEATAGSTAIAMVAGTTLTKEEGRVAFRASFVKENDFVEIRHAYGQAGLDNGRVSVAG
jgi:hypothetical protein